MKMFLQLLSCLFILAGCLFPPESKKYISVDCEILSYEGVLQRQYPGSLCLFFDDGSYVSTDKDKMRRIDRFGRTLWSLSVAVHHELTFDQQKENILYITSEDKIFLNHLTRFDIVNVMSKSGKLLKQYKLFDHKEEIMGFSDVHFKDSAWYQPSDLYKTPFEFSHINSIQEIPENDLSEKIKAFEPGNYIVSFNGLGLIVILDHELKKILWYRKDPQKIMFSSHSAEVTPEGHILFFNNMNRENTVMFSSIDEIDPLTNKVVWQLKFPEVGLEINPYWGGVQWLDQKTILITENSKEGRVAFIDKEQKKIVHQVFNRTRQKKTARKFFWYRGRYLDLSSFFKNSLL